MADAHINNKFAKIFAHLSVLILAVFISLNTQASFKQALEYYKNKSFEDAYFTFKNMAAVGDKSSQFNLGVMYFRGEHVKQDSATAYAWMTLAAESGQVKYIETAEKIYGKLDEKSKAAADNQLDELSKIYSAATLSTLIVPQPLNDEDCEKAPAAKKKLSSKYPKGAFRAGKMKLGYADLTVNFSMQGYARDLTLRLKTNDIFIKPSVDAMLRGRWEPKLINGKPSLSRDHYYRFSYTSKDGKRIVVNNIENSALATLGKAKDGDVASQYKYAKTLKSLKAFRVLDGKLDLEYQAANEWFLKAAQQGHPLAQYELGKNMIAGRGCKTDTDSGLKWLRAAASAGHPFAQEELAMSALYVGVSDEHRLIYWLRKSAANNYYKGKLFLAWHLVTTTDNLIFDPKEAIQLLNSAPSMYYDQVRIEETKAAVYAALGDFEQAIKWQLRALKTAKKLRWEIPIMETRLAEYQSGSRWIGMYHI